MSRDRNRFAIRVLTLLDQLALKPEMIFEKMVLTAGITAGGRKPATTTATNPAIKAYSIMS